MSIDIQITPEMKRQFSLEVDQHLDQFEQTLLALEKNPQDAEAIKSAFRSVHSIKGNSDYVGIRDINTLAHNLEDLLDEIRLDRLPVNSDVTSLCLESLDLLREMNRHVSDYEYHETDISDLRARFGAITESASNKPPSEKSNASQVNVAAVFVKSSEQHISYVRGTINRVFAGETLKDAKANALRVLRTFRTSANYVGAAAVVNLLSEMETEVEKHRSFNHKTAQYLEDKLGVIEKLLAQMAGPARVEPDNKSHDVSSEITKSGIRVAPERIDKFFEEILELTIAHNSLNHLIQTLGIRQDEVEWRNELRRVGSNVGHIANSLQTTIMKMRLVKFDSVFERLPRIVRDLSTKNRKKVSLTVSGGETEVDRKIIELLVDPMVHIIRNAVDHGMESTAERIKMNKPELGAIEVSAHQEGKFAIIEIDDDGRGIDIDLVRKQAIARNMISHEVASVMGDEEIMNLIFRSGLSTASRATKVSGRGVGLDVVKSNMRAIGGNVTISSRKGVGTTVRMQIPISMAVIEALLTETGGDCYAFPFSCILETVKISPAEIQVVNKREVISHRGSVLAIRHLGDILGVTENPKLRGWNKNNLLSVIVVSFGGQVTGIVVDRILRREGILARPLEQHLANIREFSSAALLGDGQIVLVLDQMGLF